MVAEAGTLGLDLRTLDDHDRALLEEMSDLVVDESGFAPREDIGPLANHPFISLLESAPFSPSNPQEAKINKEELDELVRSGLIVKWEDFYFSNQTMTRAGKAIAQLLLENPNGVSAAQAKEVFGTSRKFALPILRLLDANGITRRRGDLRIGGPRLPPLDPTG